MTIIYGIHNCDTVKKSRVWLDQANIPYQFHDLRKDGLDEELLTSLAQRSTWEQLINKRSTTYRSLSDEVKLNLTGELAIKVVLEQPTLLKRPLLLNNDQLHLGFKPAQYQQIFNHE